MQASGKEKASKEASEAKRQASKEKHFAKGAEKDEEMKWIRCRGDDG